MLFRLSGERLPGAGRVIRDERSKLGAWHRAERVTAVVFVLTALAWILRAPKQIGELTIPGIQSVLPQVGASMAFMLPVATPPNAIVFGTGYISPGEMSRAGLWLNFITIILVSLAVALSFG